MQKSEMSSSSASNDEKPGLNQSAFWWLIGLATLLLLGSALFAWKQLPNPNTNRIAAPGWTDTLRYPIEQNVFKRVPIIDVALNAVFSLDQRVWAVGDRGLIVHSEDGGRTWDAQTSRTEARLFSITFHADGQQGWAAGDGGTILKTVDGGKTWQAIAYRSYPPPGFYLLSLIALAIYATVFWWRARLSHLYEQTQSSTAMNRGVTDNPVGPGEQDFLGARLIADSLTRFLTNENTRPPLTLAITGEWGSGKSSVMNYLSGNLKRKGLKPVWFNAWHHREEPSVLARFWPMCTSKRSNLGGRFPVYGSACVYYGGSTGYGKRF